MIINTNLVKKKIVFVFFAFVVSYIAAAQNKKPVHDRDGIDTLHHQKAPGRVKGKQISATKRTGANKSRGKDSLKAMNDPMTKLEKPGHDSTKLSKSANPPRQRLNEGRVKQKKQAVK
jgi:hypothetical protein